MDMDTRPSMKIIVNIEGKIMSKIDKSDESDELLDTKKAAIILDVKPDTLAVWRCTKRYALPYITIGRNIRYWKSDLTSFIAANRKGESDE